LISHLLFYASAFCSLSFLSIPPPLLHSPDTQECMGGVTEKNRDAVEEIHLKKDKIIMNNKRKLEFPSIYWRCNPRY